MKKIGIDARLYSQTGVGTYIRNLIYYLEQLSDENIVYYIYLRKKDYLRVRFKKKNFIKRLANHKWHSFGEQFFFLIQLLKDDLDLVHFTYFSYPILYFKKFIVTIHDLTPLLFRTGKASTKNPLIYYFKYLIFRLVLFFQIFFSTKIITPSKTVANQILKIYSKKLKKKIVVVYEGVDFQFMKTKENKGLAKKYQNFFIYVGNFYPHKNIGRLIESFKFVKKPYRLILIGPENYFTQRISNLLKLSPSKNRIILIKNPKISDLVFFYKKALAIINPSLSEGFGLPLVEAAYFGTPIIASNIKIFKELWKDQYLCFNPYKIKDIARTINKFIHLRPRYNYEDLLRRYSFEKMTTTMLNIYKKILFSKAI